MKLIPALGSLRMQKALASPLVHDIVDILLRNQDLLIHSSALLMKYDRRASLFELKEDLEFLQFYVDTVEAEHAQKLLSALQKLYWQSDEDIRYQRGAILEVLVYKLISPRYKTGECESNHRIIDNKYASDQIDVVAISNELRQVEGYECKMKCDGVESSDCTNLSALVDVAMQNDYLVNVGIITLNNEKYMRKKLKRFNIPACIQLYGLNNLRTLSISPFQNK